MNSTVRTYLITTARQKDKFVYYSDVVNECNLDINLSSDYGQHQLSVILGEVSAYEYLNKRPLISAMAIYKDERRNDHGDGFYKLSQELGIGKFKVLKDDLYGFSEAEECRRFWQNENNYTQFATLRTDEEAARSTQPQFFTLPEIDFFKQWQYKTYNADLPEHINAKNQLMNTVWEKSKYLGTQIVNEVAGFKSEGKKYWSQRGWDKSDGVNVQAAIFKPYTWIKVYRNTDKGKDIFFTFGIDVHPHTNAFVYKIDCQRTRDSKLSPQQISLFDDLVPQPAKWNTISFDDLLKGNWKSLIDTCVDFINRYLTHYDVIINALYGDPIPSNLFKNTLVWRSKPQNGLAEIPERQNSFQGVDVDFQQKAKEQKDLGNAGETLVVDFEKKYLLEKERPDLSALVAVKKDGQGYDVFSFDEFGTEKYIEVKTTTGNEYTSFYLSDNEVAFMRAYPDKYHIYRIYHYDAENNFGECFKISGAAEDQLLMKPISYQVYLKKIN